MLCCFGVLSNAALAQISPLPLRFMDADKTTVNRIFYKTQPYVKGFGNWIRIDLLGSRAENTMFWKGMKGFLYFQTSQQIHSVLDQHIEQPLIGAAFSVQEGSILPSELFSC